MNSNALFAAQPAPSIQRLIAAAVLGLLLLSGCAPGEDAKTGAAPAVDALRGDIEEIFAIGNRLERVEALAAYLQRAPKSSEAAAEIAAGIDESTLDRGDIELVLFGEWWARFEPMAAFEWTRKDWRAEHPRIVYAVMRVMAQDDPQTAIDAYHTIKTNQESYPIFLQPVIVGWHESGRPGIIPFIVSQPSTQLQQLALGTLARRQVLSLGPEKAIEWAEEIVGDQGATFERQVFQRIASSIAELEPEAAAAWVEGLVKEKGASETLLRRVSGRWARRDGASAMAWLGRFAPSDHQQQAVSQTFNLWRGREPEVATAWLAEQGEERFTSLGPATAALIKGRVNRAKGDSTLEIDWLADLALAEQVVDKDISYGLMTQIGRLWMTRDEPAARIWLASAGLPETYQRKIEAAAMQEGMTPRP